MKLSSNQDEQINNLITEIRKVKSVETILFSETLNEPTQKIILKTRGDNINKLESTTFAEVVANSDIKSDMILNIKVIQN